MESSKSIRFLAANVQQERRVPPLGRGWRTPDPSPTREVADLPSCKPGSWWLLEESHDEMRTRCASSSTVSDLGRPTLKLQSGSFSELFGSNKDESTDGQATFNSHMTSMSPRSFPEEIWSRTSTTATSATMACTATAAGQFCTSSAKELWTNGIIPPPPEGPPTIRQLIGLPEDCPSIGSMYHPHGCADFCKYAKKPRGCKDGDACVRCHLCKHRKYVPRQSEGSTASPARSPTQYSTRRQSQGFWFGGSGGGSSKWGRRSTW